MKMANSKNAQPRLLNRRCAMQIGVCGALGLSLADVLRAQSTPDGKAAPAKSVIHLQLAGGFSAQESWDPKPDASVEYRGPFGVTNTNTGDLFSDRIPRIAQVADKFTVLR